METFPPEKAAEFHSAVPSKDELGIRSPVRSPVDIVRHDFALETFPLPHALMERYGKILPIGT